MNTHTSTGTQVEHTDIRTLATGVLGQMFSSPKSTLHKSYESTWKTWMERRHDKAFSIREIWVKFALRTLESHPELSEPLSAALKEKLMDPDDKIRGTVVQGMGNLDSIGLAHVSDEVLKVVGERCKDKKPSVRQKAIVAMGKIWNSLVGEMFVVFSEKIAGMSHKKQNSHTFAGSRAKTLLRSRSMAGSLVLF